MNRVSTAGSYSAVLANIQSAQTRANEASNQYSSQKKASDYKGYARSAELLTAMRGVQTKVDGFIDQGKVLTSKLDMQASALGQVSDAAQSAREAIAGAIASDNGDTLMQTLQAALTDAVAGLNTKHGGRYLFAGGQVDTQPVIINQMSEVGLSSNRSDLFANDDFKASNRVDESTSIQTGFLANEVGTPFFTQLKAIQQYVTANGPFTDQLTDAQKTFLQGVLPGFDTVYEDLTAVEAQNGVLQNQVDNARTDLDDRADMLAGMTGDITDVDLPTAYANMQAAQLSVQAAAQVFASLKESSLLEILK
jgi:flagellar hook-associated protein 3 FlgL